ncbi:MAG: polysaccharide biosynthesis C-terminal domain-containing protein [Bacteroidales bacterium]|nr:polysaccharide biosynthesis C-terminal domain-containing protein [Bacteroidales bacterium]
MTRNGSISALGGNQFLEAMLVLISAELADAICGIVDGVFVARFLGEEGMAAHGIASPIFEVLCIFSYMITAGFQQPCTVYIGRGKTEHANGLFTAAMLLTMEFAILCAVPGLFFTSQIAHIMGAPSGGIINTMAVDYLKAVFIGTPFLLLFLSLIPVLQLDGQRNLVHLGCLVMGVSDVVIDLLNVKVFHAGMWGFGMATSVSYLLGTLVLLTYFMRKDRLFRLHPRAMRSSRPGAIFTSGLPSGIRVGARSIAIIALNSLVMGTAGVTAMAAFAVQQNLSSLLLSAGVGISGATLLFSGISYGEQDRRGLIDVIQLSGQACVVVIGFLSAIVFALARPLVGLYLSPDDASFTLAIHAVRYLALSMPLVAIARCMGSYEQGVEQNRKSIWAFLMGELLALVPCALLMGWLWGVEGIFASFAVSQFLVILLKGLYAIRHRDRRFKGLESVLDVPSDFGVPPEDRLYRTVVHPEEVWELAAQAQTFCQERGIAPDKAYAVSMYIEEMGNIVMIYGFADGKSHHLEIRLSLYQGTVILRFRDDCKRFDITERASHWKEDIEHPETTLGVRMIMNSSGYLRYDNSLRTNNLLVHIQ